MSKAFDVSTMTLDELRFMTKTINTYNNILIDQNELKKHVILTEISQKSSNRPAKCNIFSRLPVEVVFTIFENMDMDSIFRLRTASVHLRSLVEAWRPFQIVFQEARPALQALIATKASKLWTVLDLQDRVFTTQCEICNSHGEILHLFKMQRVCFNCVTTDRRLLAITPQYAIETMGLSQSDLHSLSPLRTVPQKCFWGWMKGVNFAVDYTAALDIAMQKHANHNPGFRLPSFLLHPPESNYLQHACCTYFPAKQRTKLGSDQVKAALCAGCIFYWNYHSCLPQQCHTLHPHDVFREADSQHPSHTQLMTHLSGCVFAKAYWSKLYLPELNHLDPNNAHLVVNGGQYTPKEMMQDQQVRLISLFNQKQARFRHFRRHAADENGLADQRGIANNRLFEDIPNQLRQAAKSMSNIECRTALDIELEMKLRRGDAQICAALLQGTSEQLGHPPTSQLDRNTLNRQQIEQSGGNTIFDIYADVLLGSGASVSQSSWAIASANRSSNLFPGWMGLLEERKRKEAEAFSRDTGCKFESAFKTIRGWGLDRLGNVSSLC